MRLLIRDAIATWIALAIDGGWAGYFLFTGLPQLTLHVFPATIALHAVAGAAILVYLAYLAVARKLPGGTPLDIPVIALVLAYALATYTSVSWRASLESTLQFGIAVIAFYVLSGLPFLDARALRRSLMLTGGALALYTLWVVGNDYADYLRIARSVEGLHASNIFPATVPRVHDVSDHPNVLAMVLTLVLPFFALAAYRAGSLWERALGCAGLFCGGWAIFLTLSRGGWAGAATGIILAVLGAMLTVRAYERERAGDALTWQTALPSGFSPTALAAVVGALALAVFGTLAFMASASTRPGWLFRGSLSPRQDAWHAGREIFGDHLLTGAGPNTFGLLYPSYTTHAAQFIVHTQHAHNGFLQLADDVGLVGLAAVLAIVVAAGFMLWRTWRHGALEQRLVAVACASALIGFSVHNQVDAGNIWKAPGIALAFVGAIIARNFLELPARARRVPLAAISPPVRRYGHVAARASLLVLAVLPLFLWYKVDGAHHDYWAALEQLNDGAPAATTVKGLQSAVNADSSMPVYQLQLGIAQATAYDQSGRTNDSMLSAAIIHLERAAALDAHSDLAVANLARVYAWAGRDDDAAREAQLTRLATYHVAPVLVAGEVYEDLGRDEDAISTYGQVLSMDAGLANSTFWQNTPWRRDHYSQILSASTVGYNPCTLGSFIVEGKRYNAASSIGGLEDALRGCQQVAFLGGSTDLLVRVSLARMLMETGDMDGALGHLEYAVDRQPDFGPARTELGTWYDRQGNRDEARHQWVIGAQLGEPESARLLGDTYAAGAVPVEIRDRLDELLKTTGSSIQNDIVSVLYYRMRYARLSPVFALIPGDWAAAVPLPFAAQRADLARWDAARGE
jgi:O-antigen ligase/tetratricopeptide (TPR) repeat protein